MSIFKIKQTVPDPYELFGKPEGRDRKVPAAIVIPNFLPEKTCDFLTNAAREWDTDVFISYDDAYGGKGDERIEALNLTVDPNKQYDLHEVVIHKAREYGYSVFGYTDLFASRQYPLYVSHYWEGCFRAFHYDGGFVDSTGKSFHDKEQEKFFLRRKLTCVVQLSDDNDYVGGDLYFMSYQNVEHTDKRKKGTAIIFPSTVWHEVSKVKSGNRYSLSLFLYSNANTEVR